MEISFEELFLVPEMSEAKLVAGVGGLNKGIHWCDIVETAAPWNRIRPGEIIFLSGVGLKNIKKDLEQLVVEMNKKSCVGLIIQKGEYIMEIPSSVKALANQNNVPIIEIPFETRVVNITYNITRNLFVKEQSGISMDRVLKEAMYMDYTDTVEEKAKFFGFSPNNAYVAATVEPDINSADKSDFDKIIYFFTYYFEEYGKKVLYTQEENLITFILPVEDGKCYNSFLSERINRIKRKILEDKNLTISIGIGCIFHHIGKFKRSSIEAKEALKMLHACKKNDDIRLYEEMGIYRVLFRVKDNRELERIYEGILGGLLQWDRENESDLVDTLEIFLGEDCNISKAANVLYIHRNTVRYKIQKIEEIISGNLKDVQFCFNLRLAYKIKRFLSL